MLLCELCYVKFPFRFWIDTSKQNMPYVLKINFLFSFGINIAFCKDNTKTLILWSLEWLIWYWIYMVFISFRIDNIFWFLILYYLFVNYIYLVIVSTLLNFTFISIELTRYLLQLFFNAPCLQWLFYSWYSF